ncbi:hypothetical protein DVA86_15160 [Streptomyces armeniacus]|uniref:Sodium:proton antiporter n=1 Tax=Streptomyces armeniacus TaxID=83291 RepID=A0A345XQ81_9ACTN|nr:DUF6328 family protein [Streptomyces armeniacus]AXK33797.1 hypothetical protein DVA86_15160 [Streptomyces armeniacus]
MDARRETSYERADRNFVELLQELRVTQTGVQILFAFLLTLAFTERFPDLDSYQRGTYIATLLLSVLAAVLFTAPAALHRALFRRGAKRLIVDVSSRLAACGLAVLALALTGAVTLVVDVVLGRAAGAVTGALALLVCAGLWAVLPWTLRLGLRRRHTPDEGRQRSPRGPVP